MARARCSATSTTSWGRPRHPAQLDRELHLHLHRSVELGKQQLSNAARTANDMAHAHAKPLRTTKATTVEAIAKMKAMRQHAHGFAELMR